MVQPRAISEETIYGTFDGHRSPQQPFEQRYRLILQTRRGTRRLCVSNLVRSRWAGIVCTAVGLILLGAVYLGFRVLKELLVPIKECGQSPIKDPNDGMHFYLISFSIGSSFSFLTSTDSLARKHSEAFLSIITV
jgi:hypothetical protein